MLNSGIPGAAEYLELEKEPEFSRLLDSSRQFRSEFENRAVFSRIYSIKWVQDPFLQWSRRWEYVYVLQRLERWWCSKQQMLEVADAGSGFTFFPFYLQRINKQTKITCIDADSTAGFAIQEAAKVLGKGPEFSLQNLERLDQESKSLDGVFSVSVIEHTSSPEQAIKEIHRVLKPGGVFVCTFDVSFEAGSPMHVNRVEQLVNGLCELFRSQDGNIGSFADNAGKSDRVTTTWVAKKYPERLPWRKPTLVWLYDALRGRFRSTLYRPMTFYCGTFFKKHQEDVEI